MERAEYERLRWRCIRRGLLELDLKLTKFLDEEFAELTDEEVQAFKVLAEMEDLDLWSLIASDRQAPDPRLTGILAKLRKC